MSVREQVRRMLESVGLDELGEILADARAIMHNQVADLEQERGMAVEALNVEQARREHEQSVCDEWKRRAELAEQRATDAELRALNMADDRPIQVSAANAETNDDLRRENARLREAIKPLRDVRALCTRERAEREEGLWRLVDDAILEACINLRPTEAKTEIVNEEVATEGMRIPFTDWRIVPLGSERPKGEDNHG
jgi:hypothetical protein